MTQARSLWLVPVPAVLVLLLVVQLLPFWQSPENVGLDVHGYEGAARVGEQWGWAQIYDQSLVRAAEMQLVPHQITLRFISPPPVAWLAAGLTPLPYWLGYVVWAVLMLGALVFALAWSAPNPVPARLVAVGVAIVPWWVLHATYVGQVVPVVAASVLIAWRLVREQRDVAAGIVLSLVLLKPQTAVVVPLALLAAGRIRVFAAWVAAAATVTGASLLTLGTHGVATYLTSLNHLPSSSSDLTLENAFGLTAAEGIFSGALIVGAALSTAHRVRLVPGIAIAAGALASLLASPYLYENDLCLLGAAGWILWYERHSPFWRASLITIWLLAATHWVVSIPTLKLWPLLELTIFLALVAMAWFGPPDRAPAAT